MSVGGEDHNVEQALTQSPRKVVKIYFSATQLGRIINIQNNWRRYGTVSIQNSNWTSLSWGQ
jgi:hypothetical protein